MRSPLSAVVLTGVIASLCFSVGEGLRLTPFPVSALTKAEPAIILVEARASDQISLNKYGPLDVPTPTQKRNKRQALDLAGPPAVATREILRLRSLSVTDEPFELVPVTGVSRPAGRAPPFVS